MSGGRFLSKSRWTWIKDGSDEGELEKLGAF